MSNQNFEKQPTDIMSGSTDTTLAEGKPKLPGWAANAKSHLHIEAIPPKHDSQNIEADIELFVNKFDSYMEDGFVMSVTDNAMAKLAFQADEMIDELELSPRPDQVLIHLNTFHKKEELDRILEFGRRKGVHNFLAVTGDGSDRMHKLEPEELEAEEVPVTTSVELIKYIRRHYPEFIIGAAFNPYEPEDMEFAKLDRKIAAGATYVITQPVFEKDPMIDRLLREYPDLPVVVEVWMSKKLHLLSDVVGYEIPEDTFYDPFATLEKMRKIYPQCGTYVALLPFKTRYAEFKELWEKLK